MLGLIPSDHIDSVDIAYPLRLLLNRKAQPVAERRKVINIVKLRLQVRTGRNKKTGERSFSLKKPWVKMKSGWEQGILSSVEYSLACWFTLS